MAKIDLTGRRFGRLVVIREYPAPYISPGGKPTRRWECVCDCGGTVIVLQNALTSKLNPTMSCGCARAETMRRVGAERQAYRICAVCGKRYPAPPSSNSVTCSPQCGAEQKRRNRMGNRRPWGEDKKAALKAAIRDDPARLDAARESANAANKAAQLSPNSGPFETNVNAKSWGLKAPNNEVYEFDNLNHFVRRHPDFFANPKSARSALSRTGQYKGWQVLYCAPKRGQS